MHLLGIPVPERRAEALARVGAIVEEPRFHAHLTGRENLRAHAAARDPEANLRIPAALERVGLSDRADDRVSAYSLGKRQRLGIARCLHDIVAHHVSLMVVQAGGLGETLPDDRSREVADSIASTGRSALAEMRRLLGVLRIGATDQSGEFEPQQGIGDIEKLLAQTRAAGVDAQLLVEGEPKALPAGVELSAYRITQEALTNVIRHAGAASVAVTVRYLPQAVALSIVDDGRGAGAGAGAGTGVATASGHGILGMLERATLFNGELSAGPRAGGGFEVRALLPFDGARS